MDNSKKNPKSIDERHKRRTLDFSFPHIKIVFVITATALLSLIASIALDLFDIPFWSSILANIFAGLLTGLVICLVSGTKQIAITKLEAEVGFLNTLDTKIKDFQNLYHELLTKPFQKYDDTEELFVFIYDVGAHANWVNEYILQGSFDERLALIIAAFRNHLLEVIPFGNHAADAAAHRQGSDSWHRNRNHH